MKRLYFLAGLIFCLFSETSLCQITLATTNGSFSENFDVMGSSGTSLPTGWAALRYDGSGTAYAALSPAVTAGSTNSGNVYNVGTAAATDRALGTLASGTTIPAFGASFINNTGSNITSFSFSGYCEQWRSGTNSSVNENVIFEYSTDATSLNTGTWAAIPSMNLVEMLTSTTSAAAVDGNVSANRVAISGSIPTLNLADGNTIWIRWRDNDDKGSDGLYAIDDFGMNWTNSTVSNTVSISAGTNASEPGTNGTFTVTSSTAAPAGGITVNYSLSGSAVSGSDYSNAYTGSVIILEGSTTATITINVLNDAIVEPTETIIATLTSVTSPYTITASSATITLSDDESTQLYSYNFATCTGSLSDGFTQQSVTGAQVWSCTTFGKVGNAVEMNGYSSQPPVGNQANEDWLISPSIDLSSSNVPLLTFYSKTKFAGDPLRLFVTTNYTGDVTTTSWTEIDGYFPPVNSDAWTLSENIDLSAFKQSNVRFAFKYTSSTAAASRINVDEINILNASSSPSPDLTINGTMLDFREVNSGTISSSKNFTLWANNLSSNLTITAPLGFEISKDGTTFSNTISYTTAETQNQQKTVYVHYVPSSANSTSFGYLQFASTGINEQKIFVKGNSYPLDGTLNIVNLNLLWFGGSQPPTDDNLQQANLKTTMDYLGADIYAVQEVVDTVRFGNLVRSLAGGYNYVVSDFTTSAVDRTDPNFLTNYNNGQKLALIYKTSLVSNLSARGLLKTTNTTASAYTNWSSGRFPYLVTLDATKNGETKTLNFIILHGKAGDTQSDYDRRKAGVKEMKDTLDAFFSNQQVIVLGDFNDALDAPIYTGASVSSYDDLIKDSTDADSYKSTTLLLANMGLHSTAGNPGMIDNAVVSNEVADYYIDYSATLFDDIESLTGIPNFSTTTSDHYPVMTRYAFEVTGAPLPVKLISFNGAKDRNQVKLTWSTAQEINSKEFVVERSAYGSNYSSIGKVMANGNSSSISNYQFNDASPNAGVNFYRLKMVDADSKFEYSKVVKIDFSKNYTITISPNPAKSFFNVTVANISAPMILEITDVSGRVLQTQTISNQNNVVAVNNLSKGLYFVKLKNANTSYTEKLVIE